jgi:predicted DCC family thiol-disulfide oxidoreductase YuxK
MRSLSGLGSRLFGHPLVVLYDGHCRLCQRTIHTLRALDVLDQLIPINALNDNARLDAGVGHLEVGALMEAMHVVAGSRLWSGFAACRAIAWRIPLLWPVLPLLYLWPVPPVGRRVYRIIASRRTCSPDLRMRAEGDSPDRPSTSTA